MLLITRHTGIHKRKVITGKKVTIRSSLADKINILSYLSHLFHHSDDIPLYFSQLKRSDGLEKYSCSMDCRPLSAPCIK
jgi:hypothetical protein